MEDVSRPTSGWPRSQKLQRQTTRPYNAREGQHIPPTVFYERGHLVRYQMSAEQLGQLYEVMHVTKDVWRPVSPEQDGKVDTSDGHERS